MKKYIISGILLTILVTFGLLRLVWAGFIYFAIVALIALSAFWIIILIDNYYDRFKVDFEDDFKLYYAQKVNYSQEGFIPDKDLCLKQYKKSQTKYKLIEIGKIIFVASIIIVCVITFFINIFK